MQYFIGIDVGTTNIKALAFREDGLEAFSASRPSPVQPLPNGEAVYDPETLWETVCSLLRRLTEELCRAGGVGGKLSGIGLTGMAEAGVPLDKRGEPLYPVIAWYDSRTRAYTERWKHGFGEERLFALTALRNQHIFTANKLLWLREREPGLFGRMRRWHCVPDYIAFCLTGQSVMDYSLAARTMLFDPQALDWSEELLEYVGVSKRVLPRLAPSGTRVGLVTKAATALSGLPEGVPVFTGGHDHICGAFAAGVFRPGCLLDSSGTSEEILTSSPSFESVQALGKAGYNVGPHVFPGQFYLAGGIPASGASVDWFRRCFGDGPPDPGGARGLIFLPHLRGSSSPERSGRSAGSFLNIRDFHTAGNFRQAVLEGVCMEAKSLADALLAGRALDRLVSIGGGTKDPGWLQTKANVMDHAIEIPEIRESTAFGAALLAAVGAGRYASCEEAFRRTYRVGAVVEPQPEEAAACRERYAQFLRAREAMHAFYHESGSSL